MALAKHFIYVFITVVSIGFCDDYVRELAIKYDADKEKEFFDSVFVLVGYIMLFMVVIMGLFCVMIIECLVRKRVKRELRRAENKKVEVKKEEEKKVEEVIIKKPIESITKPDFIEKKKSAEKETETRYRNQGTVLIKSQNVTAPDLGVGLDEEAAEKKKKGGINQVKWSSDPIVFYEIGDDLDRFEDMVFDAKGGGFSSSSEALTATIKKL